jgi:hypothetical protein
MMPPPLKKEKSKRERGPSDRAERQSEREES